MKIDPRDFGISSKTKLEITDEKTIAIVIARKSRLIMADGKRIAEKAAKIKKARPNFEVVLKTSAQVCGKTRNYLQWEGIEIVEVMAT